MQATASKRTSWPIRVSSRPQWCARRAGRLGQLRRAVALPSTSQDHAQKKRPCTLAEPDRPDIVRPGSKDKSISIRSDRSSSMRPGPRPMARRYGWALEGPASADRRPTRTLEKDDFRRRLAHGRHRRADGSQRHDRRASCSKPISNGFSLPNSDSATSSLWTISAATRVPPSGSSEWRAARRHRIRCFSSKGLPR
jgi:hypothetical protein